MNSNPAYEPSDVGVTIDYDTSDWTRKNDAQQPADTLPVSIPEQDYDTPLEVPPTMTMIRSDINHYDEHNIFNFTEQVKLDYTEVFGFPEHFSQNKIGIGMKPYMNKVVSNTYEYASAFVYFVLTLVGGVPMAFCYGIMMGATNFFNIWVLTPYLKCIFTVLRLGQITFRAILRTVTDPVFESVALVYSAINVNFKANIADLNIQAVQAGPQRNMRQKP